MIHTREKNFITNPCDEKFTQKHRLIEFSKHTPGERNFIFNISNKDSDTHHGEKNFIFDNVYDKKITHKQHLTTNLKTHTVEIHFIFNVSNTNFVQKSDLKLHTGKMHLEYILKYIYTLRRSHNK